MKEMTNYEFHSLCTTDQLEEFNKILQIMAIEDAHPMMEGTSHIEGYIQEVTHFLKIRKPVGPGLEFLAVDMDYFWLEDEIKGRVITVYRFESASDLELARYKMHIQQGANPILN